MGLGGVALIGVGLSMDAFAVSVCKGLSMKKINYIYAIIIAAFFGVFQAVMPLIGWLLGIQFEGYVSAYGSWIAFALLAFIGAKMIYEAIKEDDSCETSIIVIKELFVLALATSIDALAVGISFSFLDVNIWQSILVIGLITFAISLLGVIFGNKFGAKYKSKAEIVGGIILILIGVKIILEYFGIL